jgi:predicted DsbA family dithiol-disulfide isomerase
MQVDVYSDVVCPWCAIGKARFEQALATFAAEGGETVEVTWRPYQLDPGAPRDPSPALDAYAKKFGGPERATQITNHVTEVAAAVGWDFDFSIAQRANTSDAHRVIALAWHEGGNALQAKVKEALMRAYFCDGGDVASHDELVAIATSCGLDRDRVMEMLSSRELVDQTNAELNDAVELGITAVPSFVFNGIGVVSGAQEPEQFVRILHRISQRAAAASPSVGDACAVDGNDC